jgi:hypothetical protein
VFSELQESFLACTNRKHDKARTCPYDGVSIRDDDYTFIHIGSREQQLLFEAANDLAEKTNIAGRRPEVAARYQKLADEFRKTVRENPGEATRATLDSTTRQNLRSLGYVE